ncbi:MAG TPA: diadenylate cyclase, partial [Kofleriaceae bacterium]|nr:diadenylate cyclase [Kofleriaceae bacterium]
FINYFIIIVIVVFQQDIRRGLMRLGQRVGAFGRTHAVTHALDEVLAAFDHLAKARIGGIVVFERDADLADFIDHGQVVDAQLSRELLAALFVPSRDNKLHDGAVIVDKALRIRNAGAVLPLSRNEQLAQEFGTRHRAALGITEETDAVAIVVSEERGEMSLCYRGSIARDLELETLRSALQGLFGDEKGREQVAEGAKAAAEIARGLAALAAEQPSAEVSESKSRPSATRPAEEAR